MLYRDFNTRYGNALKFWFEDEKDFQDWMGYFEELKNDVFQGESDDTKMSYKDFEYLENYLNSRFTLPKKGCQDTEPTSILFIEQVKLFHMLLDAMATANIRGKYEEFYLNKSKEKTELLNSGNYTLEQLKEKFKEIDNRKRYSEE